MACESTRSVLFVAAIVFLCCAMLPEAIGLQHNVGGSAGWTLPSRANLTYQDWESTQSSFVVGDTLFFKYSASQHNVMVVSEEDYNACNYSHPIAMYDDGMTLLELDEPGTYFFICGVPGHCDAGQKVAVTVTLVAVEPETGAAPAPSPYQYSTAMSPSPPGPVPSPSRTPKLAAPSSAPAPSSPSRTSPILSAPSPAPATPLPPISATPSPAPPTLSGPPASSPSMPPAYAPAKSPAQSVFPLSLIPEPPTQAPGPSSGDFFDSAATNQLRLDALLPVTLLVSLLLF